MALHFSLEQMARLREDARTLSERAIAHETDLQRLLTSAERELSDGPAANRVAQVAAVGVAKQLCLDARAQQIAADRLMIDLGEDPHAVGAGRQKPPVVLIVDDHSDSREWLTVVLHGAGYMVRTASNGLEAVIAAHQLRPAVIVMDIGMPVLDGFEATRLIKAIDELRAASVIAYTAEPIDHPRFNSNLFTAVLPKPSAPDHLLATVQRYAHPVSYTRPLPS